ncbi:hypothetical protein [Peristeroidobacter agariperforans]|uniref:hypothetical protein n=1 Tax=Peristeroidobacter agariperforans TaxID=268404 RepID=UPI00101BB1B6|nr:hypothetical protein [Peristeroidobacter agariperforans]
MTVLDFFLGTSMPLQARGTMDANGLSFSKTFEVEKRCEYEFDLRLIHKIQRINMFKHLLVDNQLPMPIAVSVYLLGDKEQRVLDFESAPRLAIRGEKWTGFTLGRHVLASGDYRIELRSRQPLPALTDVEFEMVVQVMPKTYCTGF